MYHSTKFIHGFYNQGLRSPWRTWEATRPVDYFVTTKRKVSLQDCHGPGELYPGHLYHVSLECIDERDNIMVYVANKDRPHDRAWDFWMGNDTNGDWYYSNHLKKIRREY